MTKIFDCFPYNGESEILEMRIKLCAPHVSRFIIVEAKETFTGLSKPVFFERDKHLINVYLDMIDYHLIKIPDFDDSWDKENYLRDQLRLLCSAGDSDYVMISDADEIINYSNVKKQFPIEEPKRIELSCYYYYYNMQSSEKFFMSLISPYGMIKDKNIGNRGIYRNMFPSILKETNSCNGGHFTYQFGDNIEKYLEKIRSSAHTELNTPRYTNGKRIQKCLEYQMDLFGRMEFRYTLIDLGVKFPELEKYLIKKGVVLYKKNLNYYIRSIIKYVDPFFLLFFIRRVKYLIRNIIVS